MNNVPLDIEFWSRISGFDRILISGCGGGYDFLQGIPLFFALKGMGKSVFLGNMSFTELGNANGFVVTKEKNPAQSLVCMKITAQTNLNRNDTYFPEKYLSEWFMNEFEEDIPVYAFKRRGVDKVALAYQSVCQKHDIQCIILVDGGSDSLMAGDENELGTPLEDIISIFAVKSTKIPSFLVCLGIGADRYHGVSDCSTFRAIAELTQKNGFLGSIALTMSMPEVRAYFDASAYVESKMPQQSIVGHYIKSAIIGKFGNYNTMERTKKQKLFVNPFMGQYYFFDLVTVAKRVKYADFCEETKNATEFIVGLDHYRLELKHPIVEEIPRTNEIL